MPLTPIHFGFGFLAKGLSPRYCALGAFVASQVVIDCEPAYYMFVAHQWPFHRWAHTLAVGIPLGAVVGLATYAVSRFVVAIHRQLSDLWETQLVPNVVAGALGGLSHSLLDALMHDDVMPFWPFVSGNPLFWIAGIWWEHLALVVAGVVGLVMVGIWTTKQAARWTQAG
jgi:hypothetical protein